jgi:hypothetical protein
VTNTGADPLTNVNANGGSATAAAECTVAFLAAGDSCTCSITQAVDEPQFSAWPYTPVTVNVTMQATGAGSNAVGAATSIDLAWPTPEPSPSPSPEPLPVNCTGSFSEWSSCNATCGAGHQTRAFTITTEAANGGAACDAQEGEVDTRACDAGPCPVDCAGTWSGWSSCNATCGAGHQTRTFTVTTEAANGGSACDAQEGEVDTRACDAGPCPVNCTGTWSDWTPCDASCGGGSQTHTFTVAADAVGTGTACEAANNTQDTQACNEAPCPVDCVGSWGNWSACSAGCGDGTRTRTFSIDTPAAHNGNNCTAAHGDTQEEPCNDGPCPVECVGTWSSWTPCNVSCGGGSQTATFGITHAAAHSGQACEATDGQTKVQECNMDPCVPQLTVQVNSASPSAGVSSAGELPTSE